MTPQVRAPETPRAQASVNAWKDQQAEYLLAQRRELAARNEAAVAAHVAAREAWPTLRFLQTPNHSAGPAAGLAEGDIAGVPPEMAEHFVKVGVATYELDPTSPASPESQARQQQIAVGTELPELYEVVRPFGIFMAGESAGFTPSAAAPHVKAGNLRPLRKKEVRKMVERTLDAARRALAGR